jgi:ribosome maturation factor RimP
LRITLLEELTETVKAEIEPALDAMGFCLVEVKIGLAKQLTHVRVVAYRDGGIGLDELSRISKAIKPRLELIDDVGDTLSLEVSSPGIDRKFKSQEEFSIFKGRGVRVLLKGESDWQAGIITDVSQAAVALRIEGELRKIAFDSITKARLDENQEIGS